MNTLKKSLFIFFFTSLIFTRVSFAGTIVGANDTTLTITSPITSTAVDTDNNDLGRGIYIDGFTGIIIDNSSIFTITGTGTVNPYGIGILSTSLASSVTSITNSGTITVTTSGTTEDPADGNAYGIFNNGFTGSVISTITNSGTIAGVSTGVGTARGINNTSGTITSIINTGNITAIAAESSGGTVYGTYNGTAIYNHGDIAGSSGSNKVALIGTITNSGVIEGTRTAINNNASANYSEANITTITNTGTISTSITSVTSAEIDGEVDTTNVINVGASGTDSTATLTTLNNSGTIKTVATGTGAYGVIASDGGTITTINNSGTIQAGTASIGIAATGAIGTINLNEGSVLIGDILSYSSTAYTLNMDVGAAKSYYVATSGTGSFTVNDLDNRPVVAGSAYAINIGSMEMAGENLFQKTTVITDAIDRNVGLTKEVWVEPYYSEITRDSKGSSSEIRKFNNKKQGFTAGWKKENTKIPVEVVLNFDQTESNIDSGEYKTLSNGLMLGLVAPNFSTAGNSDVSVKGLVGFSKSDTDRKLLDSTSSTGERVLTGDYYSLFSSLGATLSNNIFLSEFSLLNIKLGADINTEIRDSYKENLYFKYDRLALVQVQPRVEADLKIGFSERSNIFFNAGIEAREVISGQTQDYSMGGTKVSYKTATPGDIYASVSTGANINIVGNVDFYVVASARSSNQDTRTYQANAGIRGQF